MGDDIISRGRQNVDVFALRAELLRRDTALPTPDERRVLPSLPREIVRQVRSAMARAWREGRSALDHIRREGRPAVTGYAALMGRAVWSAVAESARRVADDTPMLLGFVQATCRSTAETVATVIRRSRAWLLTRLRGRGRMASSPAPVAVVQPSAAPALDALASEDLMLARSRLGSLEVALGYDHPRVAAELHLIGAIHHDAHRHAEAIAFYGAALGIRERTLGADHPEVAATLEDMAVARSEAGEEAEAARLLARAERIRRVRHVANEPVLEAAT